MSVSLTGVCWASGQVAKRASYSVDKATLREQWLMLNARNPSNLSRTRNVTEGMKRGFDQKSKVCFRDLQDRFAELAHDVV